MLGKQLKLLLWKNYLVKKRRKGSFIAEIVVPLLLFLLLAWARSRRAAVQEDASSYIPLALPSTGTIAFMQSLYCGGSASFTTPVGVNGSAAEAPISQALDVLDRHNLTYDRLVQIFGELTDSLTNLNSTLATVNTTTQSSQNAVNDLRNLIANLSLPAFPVLVSNLNDGSNPITNTNYTAAREDIRSLCNFARDIPSRDFSTLTNNSLVQRVSNSSTDTFQNIIESVLGTSTYTDTYVPLVLDALQSFSPSTFNFTNSTRGQIQDTIRNATQGNNGTTTSTSDLRDQLTSILTTNNNSSYVNSVVAALVGLGTINDTISSLRNLTSLGSLSDLAAVIPLNSLSSILLDVTKISIDLQDLSDAYNEILAIPAFKKLATDLTNQASSAVVSSDLSALLCPSTQGASTPTGISANDLTRSRRSVRMQAAGVEVVVQDEGEDEVEGESFAGEEEEENTVEVEGDDGGEGEGEARSQSTKVKRVRRAAAQPTDNPITQSTSLPVSQSFKSVLDLLSKAKIHYAPNTSADVREIIRLANRTFEELATLQEISMCVSNLTSTSTGLDYMNLNFWLGFSDEDSLIKASMGDDKLKTVIGGVVFNSLVNNKVTKNADVAIRMHSLKTPRTDKLTDTFIRPGPGGGYNMLYYTSAFVPLQDMIERAIVNFHADGYVNPPAGYVQQFPTPPYRSDTFAAGISRSLPLLCVLAFIYSVSTLVKGIVYEKEQRLKEAMKMMGLTNRAHWMSWFLTSFIQWTIIAFLLTLILIGGRVVKFANPLLLFILLELFVIATIVMSFLISVFFSKARLASACAGLIYFLFYMPYIFVSIQEDSLAKSNKILSCLSSTTAFGLVTSYLARLEESAEGLTFKNLNKGLGECDNFTPLIGMMMMVLDIFIYALLTWYFETVFPGEFGIPRPWFFPFQKSYWFGNRTRVPTYDMTTEEENPGHQQGSGCFEEQPNMDPGIIVKNLVKVYESSSFGHWMGCKQDTPVRAVDNLTFTAYKSHITGLLGHNGAGKTTTMSILTGLFPPTSGTAVVNGYDIHTDIDEVRHSLGICPQFNVLFDRLTVAEHMLFTAMLKGMSEAAAKAEIDTYIHDVGLEEKRNCYADTLSGGQKRKLSVVLAFVGGSEIVILDEPTAGVDPSARRAIWDILLHYRKTRTILLSTHHMDEADVLSDRIAIIARGRLQCIGSPLFLKRAFDAGFTVVISTSDRERNLERLVRFVCERVSGAELCDAAGQDISFSLPPTSSKQFERFFADLEDQKDALGVLSFGVSATTLEEVFIKVAEKSEMDALRRDSSNNPTSTNDDDDINNYSETDAASDAELVAATPTHSSLSNVSMGNSSFQSTAQMEMRPLRPATSQPSINDGDLGNNGTLHQFSNAAFGASSTDGNDDNVDSKYSSGEVDGNGNGSDGYMAIFPDPHAGNPNAEYLEVVGETSAGLVTSPLGGSNRSSMRKSNGSLHKSNGGSSSSSNANSLAARAVSTDSKKLKTTMANRKSIAEGMYTGRMNSGLKLAFQRYRALLTKRLQYAKKDRKAVFSQVLLPAFFVLIGMLVATAFPPPGDLPSLHLTLDVLSQRCDGSYRSTTVPFANTDGRPPSQNLSRALVSDPGDFSRYTDVTLDREFRSLYGSNMTAYLLGTYSTLAKTRRGAATVEQILDPLVSVSAQLVTPGTVGEVYRAWYDNNHRHSMPVMVNTINNAVLRSATSSEYTIKTSNYPLNKTLEAKTEQYLRSGTDLTVAINVIIALSFVPASFVLFLVAERESNSKHQQFVSGVTPNIYWFANITWDLMNYLVPAIVCLIVFLAFGLPAYTGRNLGSVVLLMLLYGFSIIPLMYPTNWLFSIPSSAYITLISANLFIGLTGTLATYTLELFSDDPELSEVNRILKWALLLFPNYCLGRGMMDLAANEYLTQFKQIADPSTPFRSPLEFMVIGRNLVFMFFEGIIFFVIVLLIEHYKDRVVRAREPAASLPAPEDADEDVAAERKRVLAMRPKKDDPEGEVLLVKNLMKEYSSRGKKKLAVDRLCVGVARGECFGLLGVNGAGKTTTFKMLTGDIRASAGEAFISGYSAMTDVLEVRQRTGYCPQFDALCDLLTGRELLIMYARIRGVPESQIQRAVSWALKHMQLDRWADVVSGSYSGGNKRKLSVAIALLGNPPVIFMDEPTTGMDPKARRFLWDQITAIVLSGRSVVLTSHSMEECEALCGRLAIMVNGKFKCLGSPQHIKSVYGDGYTLVMKVRGNPPNTQPLVEFIEAAFPGSTCQECHNGYVRYQIPSRVVPPLSRLFGMLEQAKNELSLEDYSVSQTSLDEIFCQFAQQQDTDAQDAKARAATAGASATAAATAAAAASGHAPQATSAKAVPFVSFAAAGNYADDDDLDIDDDLDDLDNDKGVESGMM